MTQIIEKEYDTKVDSKKRITVKGTQYNYYHVKQYKDGHIELNPRILVKPIIISKNTLKGMDKSIMNFKKGKTSKPIKLSKYH